MGDSGEGEPTAKDHCTLGGSLMSGIGLKTTLGEPFTSYTPLSPQESA